MKTKWLAFVTVLALLIPAGNTSAFNYDTINNPFGFVAYSRDLLLPDSDSKVLAPALISQSMGVGWMQAEGANTLSKAFSWGKFVHNGCFESPDGSVDFDDENCMSYMNAIHEWITEADDKDLNILLQIKLGSVWGVPATNDQYNVNLICDTGRTNLSPPNSWFPYDCPPKTVDEGGADTKEYYQRFYDFVYDVVDHFDGSKKWDNGQKDVPRVRHFSCAQETNNAVYWGGTEDQLYGDGSVLELQKRHSEDSVDTIPDRGVIPVMYAAIDEYNDNTNFTSGDVEVQLISGAYSSGAGANIPIMNVLRAEGVCVDDENDPSKTTCDPSICATDVAIQQAVIIAANTYGISKTLDVISVENCRQVVKKFTGARLAVRDIKKGHIIAEDFFEASLECLNDQAAYDDGYNENFHYAVHDYGSVGGTYYDRMEYVNYRLCQARYEGDYVDCQADDDFYQACSPCKRGGILRGENMDNLSVWQTGAGLFELPNEGLYAHYQGHSMTASFAAGHDWFTFTGITDPKEIFWPWTNPITNTGIYKRTSSSSDQDLYRIRHPVGDTLSFFARIFNYKTDNTEDDTNYLSASSVYTNPVPSLNVLGLVNWRIYQLDFKDAEGIRTGSIAAVGCPDKDFGTDGIQNTDPFCNNPDPMYVLWYSYPALASKISQGDHWAVYDTADIASGPIDPATDTGIFDAGDYTTWPAPILDVAAGDYTKIVVWGPSTDGDNIPDFADNCPTISNNDQAENAGEIIKSSIVPGSYLGIISPDGIGTLCDNCPNFSNPGQEDADGDEVGDVCE